MATDGRVLVVDDDPDIREAICDVLSMRGIAVDSAGDAEAALAAMEREAPALVLLDLRMPGVSGEELLVRLRARPALAEVPVVVLSGDADAARVAAALRADGWLPKPIEMAELLAVVRRFCKPETPAPGP